MNANLNLWAILVGLIFAAVIWIVFGFIAAGISWAITLGWGWWPL